MDSPAQQIPSASRGTLECSTKPKPCCVCKDEKAKRDECMLFSKSDSPMLDCKVTIDSYKSCMKGFGFEI